MEKRELKRNLLPRHVRMMAIGGSIGAGLFKGSSEAINLAGPAVVLSYLLAGILLFMVMGALAEMATIYPHLDLRGLINRAFGYKVSFITGWLYWFNWIIVTSVEVVAASSFLNYWFPLIPIWISSLFISIILIFLNLVGVRLFGEVEFWLSGIKVTVILLFTVLGTALILNQFFQESLASQHLTSSGGFFPLGWGGIFSSLLIVVFSYGGSELIGMTITETKQAEKVLPKIINGVVVRVTLFYIFPILIICTLIPWNKIGVTGSPFVYVFSHVGLGQIANLMNFVMLTAVLSAANSGVYATSRMLYSLANNKEAPRAFTCLTKNGVPFYGILISAIGLIIGAMVALIWPNYVFRYLMGIPGVIVLHIWILICLTQLRLRPLYPSNPLYKTKLFPYTAWISVISLFIIFIGVTTNSSNIVSTIIYGLAILILTIFSFRKNLVN